MAGLYLEKIIFHNKLTKRHEQIFSTWIVHRSIN